MPPMDVVPTTDCSSLGAYPVSPESVPNAFPKISVAEMVDGGVSLNVDVEIEMGCGIGAGPGT